MSSDIEIRLQYMGQDGSASGHWAHYPPSIYMLVHKTWLHFQLLQVFLGMPDGGQNRNADLIEDSSSISVKDGSVCTWSFSFILWHPGSFHCGTKYVPVLILFLLEKTQLQQVQEEIKYLIFLFFFILLLNSSLGKF